MIGVAKLLPSFLCAANLMSHVGNFYPMLKSHADDQPCSASFLAQEWADLDAWRAQGRARMHELLAYEPPAAPLNPRVIETVQKKGYTRSLVRYTVAPGRETEAYLLVPDSVRRPLPAVIVFHDHGGFYYFGKEKSVETDDPPAPLREHIDTAYAGRAYADELARRGFVVLAPDAFYFGSQRLLPDTLPARLTEPLSGLEPGSDAYIRAYNSWAQQQEALTAKTIFASGATWPGILFQGDRVAVDYLLSRPEVDPDRIGCAGLSIGGFRSAHLFGLDSRVRTAVVAGWMTTYAELLFDHLEWHTWMIYVPRQQSYLDLPDVVTLNAPNPVMIINCSQDVLFTMGGMSKAEAKIRQVYAKIGAPEAFQCKYYDEPHSFKIPAQDDATAWLERWLKQQERQEAGKTAGE